MTRHRSSKHAARAAEAQRRGLAVALAAAERPPVKMCDGKVRHPSKDRALRASARLRRSTVDRFGDTNARYVVYRCDVCRCWHVGHKVKGGHRRDGTAGLR